MKCIQYKQAYGRIEDSIFRVSNEEAKRLVEAGEAIYVGKTFWKKHVRDAEIINQQKEVTLVS